MSDSPVPDLNTSEVREALKRVTGAVIWLDPDGTVMHVNKLFSQEFGIQSHYFEDRNWVNFDQGFSQLKFDKLWKKLCEEDRVSWETTLSFEADAAPVNVQIEALMVENDFCQQACLRVSPLEYVRPEKQLLKIITQYSKTAVWAWELSNSQFHISDYYHTLLALPDINTTSPTGLLELLKPHLDHEQLTNLRTKLTKLRRAQERLELRWLLKLGDQEKLIVLAARSTTEDDRVVRLEGTLQELRPLEKRRFQQIAAEIVEHDHNPILILDHQFAVVHANRAACRNLQYDLAELLHRIPIAQIDVEHTGGEWKRLLATVAKQKRIVVESSLQRKDGTIYPVNMIVSYYQDRRGAFIHLVAVDISQQRKQVSELQPALLQQQLLSDQLEAEKNYLQEELGIQYKFENIISVSPAYRPVLNQIKQVAGTDATVLIQGETGTGKELIARAIHELSDRKQRTMIKLNCANLPKDLIESELFGHEKGAFTGAVSRKKGRFELADKGTLFLDEIGEMPLELQTRLLRVLQEGEFERVGGSEIIGVDVRIIAATNRSLKQMVNAGTFRKDLYYRLHVFPIDNLPLRDRKEDIPVLTRHFMDKYGKKMNRGIQVIKKGDLVRLLRYDFPGNIRELENIIERSVILSSGSSLNLDYWEPENRLSAEDNADFATLEELQRVHILSALERTKWRVSGQDGAAQLLGMKDQTLFSRMRKLGIDRNANKG